jgi:hypothetical protein
LTCLARWLTVTAMPRWFNTAGPCRPEMNYTLPTARRIPRVPELIDQQAYFVVHAPRQVGKTTSLLTLGSELTAEGRYAAVLLSMEVGAGFPDDTGAAELAILDAWRGAALSRLPAELRPPPWPAPAGRAAARRLGLPLDVHGGLLRGDPGAHDHRADDLARRLRHAALGGRVHRSGGDLRVEGALPHDPRRRVPGRADRPQGDRGAQAGDRLRRAHPGPPGRLPRAARQGRAAPRGQGPDGRHLGPLHPVLPRGGRRSWRRTASTASCIDLRTIVPPDMEAVLASVRKTGRLLVVHEDRVFSSLGREIQGAVHEAMRGEHVISRVLGQDAVPGIPSPMHVEEQIVVSPEKVYRAAHELMAARKAPAAVAAPVEAPRGAYTRPQILWTPSRNFVT